MLDTKFIWERTSKKEPLFSSVLKVLVVPCSWAETLFFQCFPMCFCPSLGLGTCTHPLTTLVSMQHPAEGDPCLQPNAHICCREFYFNSLNIMPSNTLWRQKSILWIYLLFLLKKSPSTHRIPPRNKWSAAIIFFTEAAELRTRSEQYLCYLLQRELWSAYCVQLLLCFPLMQIKSLYCLFADFVFHSLITWGFIFFFFSFLYVCISQCHKGTHFGVKDLILSVAECSGLCSPAPVLCSKHISVKNKWLHHIH